MMSNPNASKALRHALVLAVILTGMTSAEAQAQTAAPTPAAPATAAASDGLTFMGLTLYGTFDIGVAYLNHGAPLSATYAAGLPFMVQKFSNRSIVSFAPNGLGQSKLGLAAHEPVTGDLAVVGRLETGFQPTSLRLTDGPRSLVANNGKALAQQTEAGDSSRAGQPFQGAAYIGLESKTFGTLTYGRQTNLMFDNLNRYDPQAQSQAFSPVGYSGVAGGGGYTEEARLDDTVKYALAYKGIRLAALHQFGQAGKLPGGADGVDLGLDLGGLSLDATWDKVDGAVSAASLTAAQAAKAPGTLSATVADTTALGAYARYAAGPAKVYAGYEHLEYANPSHPLPAGGEDIGGYVLSTVSNTAFAHHKVLQISWVGVRYAVTKALDVTGAYYRYDQNSYKGNGCRDTSASSCSGTMNAASLVAAYKLVQHFDVYAGVNYSAVADGLASGYLKTSAAGPMAGARFNF